MTAVNAIPIKLAYVMAYDMYEFSLGQIELRKSDTLHTVYTTTVHLAIKTHPT
jgi:hypothetical protein